jgi:hypothetical protein
MNTNNITTLLAALLVYSAQANPGITFNERKEAFFQSGESTCITGMTSIKQEDREEYCKCVFKIIRSTVKDDELKQYFRGNITFEEIMPPVSGDQFDICDKFQCEQTQ